MHYIYLIHFEIYVNEHVFMNLVSLNKKFNPQQLFKIRLDSVCFASVSGLINHASSIKYCI